MGKVPKKTKTTAKSTPKSKASEPLPQSPSAAAEIPVTITVNGQPITISIRVEIAVHVTTSVEQKPVPKPTPHPHIELPDKNPIPVPNLESTELATAATAISYQVFGGQRIKCGNEEGTATIACFRGNDLEPVLITAGHVVGGKDVTTENGFPIGTVDDVLPSQDVAIVKLNPGIEPVFQVVENGAPADVSINDFRTRAKAGELVLYGSASGKKVRGEFVPGNAAVVVDDVLSKTDRTLQGMFEISPLDSESFGVHGDSGSPILQESDTPGLFNLVGLLVAVDNSTGHGFAEHFGGAKGLTKQLDLFETR
jgi:hypothetical protein